MAADERTALVTGAAGFIGSHVCEGLLARGVRVVGLDCLDDFYSPALKRLNLEDVRRSAHGDRFEFVEGDFLDAEKLDDLFRRRRFHTVTHLAARAGVRPSIEQPALYARVNIEGTVNILEAARRHECASVTLASSSSVYGNNKKVPFSEEDEVEAPISPYAATKRSCELIAHTYHHLYELPVSCLRFFTVFGPRQRPDLAIAKFMRRMARGESIPVFGDGATSRDYTYIDDIVGGVLSAIERTPRFGFRIWNLGGKRPVTLREMIDGVGEVVGAAPKIERLSMQPGDVERTCADLSRVEAELGYAAETTFSEGLARQWAWTEPRLETLASHCDS